MRSIWFVLDFSRNLCFVWIMTSLLLSRTEFHITAKSLVEGFVYNILKPLRRVEGVNVACNIVGSGKRNYGGR